MRLDKLKRAAARYGMTIEDDRQQAAIYVHAPEGQCFEQKLHYRLYDYEDLSESTWRGLTIQEAYDDLEDLARTLEPCVDPECDVCHPERGQENL
jgi:hypothetical protein